MDIAKFTAEVDELVQHAQAAYDAGSTAAANVLLDTALSKLPNHVGAKALRERMQYDADEAAEMARPKLAPGDLGSTDELGLATFVTTHSHNPPKPKSPDELAPWEGGDNPLNPKQKTKPQANIPAPMPRPETLFAPKASAPRAQGEGVDMPEWVPTAPIQPPLPMPRDAFSKPEPMPTYGTWRDSVANNRKQPEPTVTVTKRSDSPYKRMRTLDEQKNGFSYPEVLPVGPIRLGLWIVMFLFVTTAVCFCIWSFSPKKIINGQIQKVDTYVQLKDYPQAISLLVNELSTAKDMATSSMLAIKLGEVYEMKGTDEFRLNQYNEAIESYRNALRQNPRSLSHNNFLANAIYETNKTQPDVTQRKQALDEALAYVSHALECDPQSTVSLYLGGRIAKSLGNVKLADKFEQDYLKLSSSKR